ncbi:MAG: ABC transporter permease [Verrucomicrobiota bacterium]
MSIWRLIGRSLWHFRAAHALTLAMVALAVAVVIGTLGTGDSIDAALQERLERRVGELKSVLVTGDRFAAQNITERLREKGVEAAALLALTGHVSRPETGQRLNQIQVLAIDADFAQVFGGGGESKGWRVNRVLADALGVKAGDFLQLSLPKPSFLPKDAPLSGSKSIEETSVRQRLQIAGLLEPSTHGSFSLRAEQQEQPTLVGPLGEVQRLAELEGQVNVIATAQEEGQRLIETFREVQTPEDFGLKLEPAWRGSTLRIQSQRLFLDASLEQVLRGTFPEGEASFSYLANALAKGEEAAPYSLVASAPPGVGPVPEGISPEGIVINQWLADDLELGLGDKLEMRFFAVQEDGKLREERAESVVEAIVAMEDEGLQAGWVPDIPGVMGTENCRDWDPGIPFEEAAIRDQDEDYWTTWGETPKALLPYARARELWGNRYGQLTEWRVAEADFDEERLRQAIQREIDPAEFGFLTQDTEELLAAAEEAMDFGGLFAGMSVFLVAAALILVGLTFRFGVEQRQSQLGLLAAVGFTRWQIGRLLVAEGLLVAFLGVGLGMILAAPVAQLFLSGLNGAWSGATVGMEVALVVSQASFLAGALATGLPALLVVAWSVFRLLRQLSLVALLHGGALTSQPQKAGAARWSWWLAAGLALGAAGLLFSGRGSTGEAAAGAFYGGGMLLLLSALLGARSWWRSQPRKPFLGTLQLVRGRPDRALAVLGISAFGFFMVAAVLAFWISLSEADSARPGGPTGGYRFFVETALPVFPDLRDPFERDALGLSREGEWLPMRLLPGDEASCLNLARARRPQLLGVSSRALEERGAFAFSSSLAEGEAAAWSLLREAGTGGAVPVVVDQNSALWALGKSLGEIVELPAGEETLRFQIVGLLATSILQGALLLDEQVFQDLFPAEAGHRVFLVGGGEASSASVASLSRALEAYGAEVSTTRDRLLAYAEVQNTYLKMFLLLGGFGLLLACVGFLVLFRRNVVEFRGQLALLEGVGVRRSRLQALVHHEHFGLVAWGIALGAGAALIAVLPAGLGARGAFPWLLVLLVMALVLVGGYLASRWATALSFRRSLLPFLRNE